MELCPKFEDTKLPVNFLAKLDFLKSIPEGVVELGGQIVLSKKNVQFLLTKRRMSMDRCYDFLNIFAEKFSEKIGVFDSKQSKIVQNYDHNIGF
jgi:hypothetical protein